MKKWFGNKFFSMIGKLSRLDRGTNNNWSEEQLLNFKRKVKPFDVISCRDDKQFISRVIPGYWGHTVLYLGRGVAIESTSTGVRNISLRHILKSYSHLAITRPMLTSTQEELIIKNIPDYINLEYDFAWNLKSRPVYCSGLVFKLFTRAGVRLKATWTLWVEKFTPDDAYEQCGTIRFDLFKNKK